MKVYPGFKPAGHGSLNSDRVLSFDSGPTGQHGTTCFYFVLCLPTPPKA
jgi:hypothetical protein